MHQTRRNFLKFAGLSAAVLSTGLGGKALAAGGGAASGGHPKVNADAAHAQRWAMVVDTRKLNTEEAIAKLAQACHKIHNVPHIDSKPKQEIKWLWAGEWEEAFPTQPNDHLAEDVEERSIALLCNHCEEPPCVRVCPTKATYKRPDGIVAMDYHRCIGCRYCMAGCPYGARSFNFMDPRLGLDMKKLNNEFPTRMRGVVEKCNFCVERLAVGQQPKCVEESGGALVFGDMNDPKSPVRKVLKEHFSIRRNPSAGTSPSVYYII